MSRWVLAAILSLMSMALLSLSFAAPASADSVTPVRHCSYGDGYRELDGDSSVEVTAPEGYLIAAYCVDSRGRRGTSEVHVLSTPQRTVLVRHSEGRSLEGYSVAYSRVDAPEDPEDDADGDSEDEQDDQNEQGENDENGGRGDDDQDGRDEASQTAAPEQGAPAKSEHATGSGKKEKREKAERTPSASATPSQPAPRSRPSAAASVQPDDSMQMSALSDGEELRTTAIAEKDDDDEEGLRSLVVAGGIIILGLLAGMIALLVRLPGQR